MTGYVRQGSYTDGDTITADHTNDEFNALVTAMALSTGHKHDGSAGEGAYVPLISNTANTRKVEVTASGARTTGDHEITGNVVVTGTVDGRDIATDGTKLDTIDPNATDDQTGAEIKALYEAEANTNAFTDADHSKLDGIEAGATGDQTASDIRALGFFDTTNDGSGSGLDADLLDGVQGSNFARTDVSETFNENITIQDSAGGEIIRLKDSGSSGATANPFIGFDDSANTRLGYVGFGGSSNRDMYLVSDQEDIRLSATAGTVQVSDSTGNGVVWHAGNDGAGSGLDADLLDGVQGSNYARTDTSELFNGDITIANTNPGLYISDTDNGSETVGGRILNTGGIMYLQSNNQGDLRFSARNGENLNNFQVRTGNNWNDIWHAGNDGIGSGLNADLLDGVEGAGYARYNGSGGLSNSLASAAYISNWGGTTNVDHIWHDDGDNSWSFCSDTTFKGAGNSTVNAANFVATGDLTASDDIILDSNNTSALFTRDNGGTLREAVRHNSDNVMRFGSSNAPTAIRGQNSVVIENSAGSDIVEVDSNRVIVTGSGTSLVLRVRGIEDSFTEYYDNNSSTYRSFGWDNGNNRFEYEDNNGVRQPLAGVSPKAWGTVNQVGTQSLQDSSNIASITDTGVGKTRFNFSSNLASTTYTVTVGSLRSATWTNGGDSVITKLTSSVEIEHVEASSGLDSVVSMTIFED